jgi:hypothetical protein
LEDGKGKIEIGKRSEGRNAETLRARRSAEKCGEVRSKVKFRICESGAPRQTRLSMKVWHARKVKNAGGTPALPKRAPVAASRRSGRVNPSLHF